MTDLAETLRRVIESRVSEIETCGPGVVQKYNASDRTADVRPMSKRIVPTEDGGIVFEEQAIIPACPVVFFGAGDFRITFPIDKGTQGTILALKWSAAKWRGSDGSKPTEPIGVHMHHAGNAIFVPGWIVDTIATPATSQNAMVLATSAAAELRLRGHDAVDKVTNDTLLQAELAAIAATLATGTANLGTGAVTFGTPYAPGATGFNKIKGKD